jgi:hypothetical protein
MKKINLYKFIRLLSRLGYNEIGSGLFGQVYSKDKSKKVIKVYQHDPAYDAFLKKIIKKKNPFFPKIYKVKRYIFEGHKVTIVLMEKLSSYGCMPSGRRENIVRKFSKYIDEDEVWGFRAGDFNPLIENYRPSNRNKFLNEAIEILNDLCDEFVLDLHPGNLMMRKSQLVFIDPIFVG